LYLSQAVYGFFQNGGTVCYAIRIEGMNTGAPSGTWNDNEFKAALAALEPITGISLVAAPGMVRQDALNHLQVHCEVTTADRFAIVETPNVAIPTGFIPWSNTIVTYPTSDYVGLYHPWIEVPDPSGQGTVAVPPSGHIAGIYARVDAKRGVFKAPGNEVIMGALGFTVQIGQSQQNVLNPNSVNCLRTLNGGPLVWGARTLIDPNAVRQDPPQMKYINARRLLNFLKDSLYAGLQWTVFEPNNATLWANVTRNVKAFLKTIWAQGALLGDTPDQAYYVKCDAENNPNPQLGTLYVEIGVCIVEPAEFVVIYLNDWAGPPQA
jgi:uncharacterized protein